MPPISRILEELWGEFPQIQLIQIFREKNAKANELFRLDLSDSNSTTGILVEILNQSSIIEEQKVMAIDAPNWRSLIIEYLKSLTARIDSQLIKLKIKATRYTLINEVLYKRSFTLPYL